MRFQTNWSEAKSGTGANFSTEINSGAYVGAGTEAKIKCKIKSHFRSRAGSTSGTGRNQLRDSGRANSGQRTFEGHEHG